MIIEYLAAGIFAANLINAMKQRREHIRTQSNLSKIRENLYAVSRQAPTQPVEIIHNVRELGFSNILPEPKFLTKQQLAPTFSLIENRAKGFINRLESLNKLLASSYGARIAFASYGFPDESPTIMLNAHGRYYKLGRLSIEGRINTASTLGKYHVTHSKFLSREAVEMIRSNRIPTNVDFSQFLAQHTMDYNTALLQEIEHTIASGGSLEDIRETAKKFREQHIRLTHGLNPIVEHNVQNAIVPLGLSNKPEDVIEYVTKFIELAQKSPSYSVHPLTLRTEEDISKGIVSNPYDMQMRDLIAQQFGVSPQDIDFLQKELTTKGNQAIRQAITKETTNIKGKVIDYVPRLQISKENKIFDKLLALGIGNEGIPGPILGEEGVIAQLDKLQQPRTVDVQDIIIPLDSGSMSQFTTDYLSDVSKAYLEYLKDANPQKFELLKTKTFPEVIHSLAYESTDIRHQVLSRVKIPAATQEKTYASLLERETRALKRDYFIQRKHLLSRRNKLSNTVIRLSRANMDVNKFIQHLHQLRNAGVKNLKTPSNINRARNIYFSFIERHLDDVIANMLNTMSDQLRATYKLKPGIDIKYSTIRKHVKTTKVQSLKSVTKDIQLKKYTTLKYNRRYVSNVYLGLLREIEAEDLLDKIITQEDFVNLYGEKLVQRYQTKYPRITKTQAIVYNIADILSSEITGELMETLVTRRPKQFTDLVAATQRFISKHGLDIEELLEIGLVRKLTADEIGKLPEKIRSMYKYVFVTADVPTSRLSLTKQSSFITKINKLQNAIKYPMRKRATMLYNTMSDLGLLPSYANISRTIWPGAPKHYIELLDPYGVPIQMARKKDKIKLGVRKKTLIAINRAKSKIAQIDEMLKKLSTEHEQKLQELPNKINAQLQEQIANTPGRKVPGGTILHEGPMGVVQTIEPLEHTATYITDIGISDKGIILRTQHVSAEHKVWSSIKALKMFGVKDTREIAAMQLYLQELQKPIQQRAKVPKPTIKAGIYRTMQLAEEDILQVLEQLNKPIAQRMPIKTKSGIIIEDATALFNRMREEAKELFYNILPEGLEITKQAQRSPELIRLSNVITRQAIENLQLSKREKLILRGFTYESKLTSPEIVSGTSGEGKLMPMASEEELIKALEEKPNWAALTMHTESYAPLPQYYGFKHTRAGVNTIIMDRLRITGQITAANMLEEGINTRKWAKLMDPYLQWTKYGQQQNAFGIDLATLTEEELQVLFGDDVNKSLELARRKTGIKELPPDAIFYLQEQRGGRAYKIPLPTVESGWTGHVKYHGYELERPIRKQLTGASYDFVRKLRSTATDDEIAKAYAALQDEVAKILVSDYTRFTSYEHARAGMYQARDRYIFDPERIQQFRQIVGEDQFKTFASKWGLDLSAEDFGLGTMHGYTSETFWKRVGLMGKEDIKTMLLPEIEKYKEMYGKSFTKKQLQILDSYFNKPKLHLQYYIRNIKRFFPDLYKQLSQVVSGEGIYEIITRNPSFAPLAPHVSRAIDIETMAKEMLTLETIERARMERGGRPLPTREVIDIRKRVAQNVSEQLKDYSVVVGGENVALTMTDFDNDPILTVAFRNRKQMQQAVHEYNQVNNILVKTLKDQAKGGLKSIKIALKQGNRVSSSIIASSVGLLFNRTQLYSVRNMAALSSPNLGNAANKIISELTQGLSASKIGNLNISQAEKLLIWEHMVSMMPEMSIGSKGITDIQDFRSLLDIFTPESLPLEQRAAQLKTRFAAAAQEGALEIEIAGQKHSLLDIFTDQDLKMLLKTGDEFIQNNPTAIKFINKQADSIRDLEHLIATVHASGGKPTAGGAAMHAVADTITQIAGQKKISSAMANTSEIIAVALQRTMKSKLFWGALAAGVGTSILFNPPDQALKHQEVRETSRPSPINQPTPAEPINPPPAYVARNIPARNRNYKGRITIASSGDVAPSNVINALNYHMGNNNTGNYVIQHSERINRQYVERMLYEQKLNTWSRE